LVVSFTLDGVGACHYDVAGGDEFQPFYYFHPQLLSAGRKNLYDAFWVSGPSIPRKISLLPYYHLGNVPS